MRVVCTALLQYTPIPWRRTREGGGERRQIRSLPPWAPSRELTFSDANANGSRSDTMKILIVHNFYKQHGGEDAVVHEEAERSPHCRIQVMKHARRLR